MTDAAPMADRHRANLTELAELGMALARGLHGRAMAATDEAAVAGHLVLKRETLGSEVLRKIARHA